ncbi:MAG: carbohydrate kinase [Flavobacteriaceae bacterium]
MNKNPQIVCFGEILWDVFPDKKVIGGAPLNVALRMHSQGHSVAIISSIGKDEEGQNIIKFLEHERFCILGIQKDEHLKTGSVRVSLNHQGSASYKIMAPVAWDAIAFTSEAEALVKNSKVFIFGSLACRNAKSKETLLKLIEVSEFSVFDVNLRPPFYAKDLLLQLLSKANFVKMNEEELEVISTMLECTENSLTEQALWINEKLNLKGICITKGDKGAILYYENEFYGHASIKVAVEDTVGAGDSFLATLIGELLIHKTIPSKSLERACTVGALVASKPGANAIVTEREIQNAILSIKS